APFVAVCVRRRSNPRRLTETPYNFVADAGDGTPRLWIPGLPAELPVKGEPFGGHDGVGALPVPGAVLLLEREEEPRQLPGHLALPGVAGKGVGAGIDGQDHAGVAVGPGRVEVLL